MFTTTVHRHKQEERERERVAKNSNATNIAHNRTALKNLMVLLGSFGFVKGTTAVGKQAGRQGGTSILVCVVLLIRKIVEKETVQVYGGRFSVNPSSPDRW